LERYTTLVGKPSKRKYLKGLLERTLGIQAQHPRPETFDSLIQWIAMRLEKQPKPSKRR
jgi:hypothetical protein